VGTELLAIPGSIPRGVRNETNAVATAAAPEWDSGPGVRTSGSRPKKLATVVDSLADPAL